MTKKPWLATILTTDGRLPTRKDVLSAMKKVPGYETLDFEWVSEETDHFVFRTKYATLAVTLTAAQDDPMLDVIPLGELKNSCARAWHWVDAGMAVQKATRQILVAVLPEENELEPLDAALLLTCLTEGVLKNLEAQAIYWNASGMVHEPASFLEHTQGMNRLTIPVELWVEFRLVLNADLTLSIGTWGLSAFGLAELEVVHSKREPQWLLHWLFNLAHYMLENGPIDLDVEHTFGTSDSEAFSISYSNPSFELGRTSVDQVLKVEFETKKEK